mgnify:CR=1 FL=1
MTYTCANIQPATVILHPHEEMLQNKIINDFIQYKLKLHVEAFVAASPSPSFSLPATIPHLNNNLGNMDNLVNSINVELNENIHVI